MEYVAKLVVVIDMLLWWDALQSSMTSVCQSSIVLLYNVVKKDSVIDGIQHSMISTCRRHKITTLYPHARY